LKDGTVREPFPTWRGAMTPFEFEKKVRFGEIDEAGIVYYPRFFNYYHLAMEEFFEQAVGTPYAEVIKSWKVGFPTVHVEADFFKPLRFGDVLVISFSVVKLGRSSVRTRYRVRRRGEDAVAAEAQLTTACVDMTTFRARVIPEQLREVFDRFHEDGPTGDEVGVR
jgi:4-hydroxybenzoyl-CoA thioesterase